MLVSVGGPGSGEHIINTVVTTGTDQSVLCVDIPRYSIYCSIYRISTAVSTTISTYVVDIYTISARAALCGQQSVPLHFSRRHDAA